MTYLAYHNRPEYNVLKCCEELTELQELLLKYINKRVDRKPPITDIVDEMGDVLLRCFALSQMWNVEEKVADRGQIKANKFMEYILANKYGNGI